MQGFILSVKFSNDPAFCIAIVTYTGTNKRSCVNENNLLIDLHRKYYKGSMKIRQFYKSVLLLSFYYSWQIHLKNNVSYFNILVFARHIFFCVTNFYVNYLSNKVSQIILFHVRVTGS